MGCDRSDRALGAPFASIPIARRGGSARCRLCRGRRMPPSKQSAKPTQARPRASGRSGMLPSRSSARCFSRRCLPSAPALRRDRFHSRFMAVPAATLTGCAASLRRKGPMRCGTVRFLLQHSFARSGRTGRRRLTIARLTLLVGSFCAFSRALFNPALPGRRKWNTRPARFAEPDGNGLLS